MKFAYSMTCPLAAHHLSNANTVFERRAKPLMRVQLQVNVTQCVRDRWSGSCLYNHTDIFHFSHIEFRPTWAHYLGTSAMCIYTLYIDDKFCSTKLIGNIINNYHWISILYWCPGHILNSVFLFLILDWKNFISNLMNCVYICHIYHWEKVIGRKGQTKQWSYK